MAISLVQTVAPAVGTGNISVTLTATLANSLLVIIASTANEGTNFISSISGGGGTYAQAAKSGANSGIEIWYGIAPISTTSLTINFTGSSLNHMLYVREYSGIATINPLDQASTGSGTSTALVTNTIGPNLEANELIVVGASQGSTTATFTAGTSYGNVAQRTDSVTDLSTLAIEDQILSSRAAQQGAITSSVNTTYAIATAMFFGSPYSPGDTLYNHVTVGDGLSRSEVAN